VSEYFYCCLEYIDMKSISYNINNIKLLIFAK